MSPSGEIQRRVRTGCVTCRRRHMKCDERKPCCRHCEIGHRSCAYDRTVKRTRRKRITEPSTFHFTPGHVWLDPNDQVTFVHQVESDIPDEDIISASVMGIQPQAAESPSSCRALSNDLAKHPTHSSRDTGYGSPHDQAAAPLDCLSPYPSISGGRADMEDPVKSVIIRRLSGSSLYTDSPRIPLTDPQAARLLQHFVDNLASWLDINDPQRHFATFVPHLALSCPILLHAILSFSASHLSRFDASFDALTGIEYHDLCVQGLIPALDDPPTAMDNVLPLSTVILRMHEMLSLEADQQRHLRGCFTLFTHNRANIGFRALKRTAFWTYVREEILVALPHSSPTNIDTGCWKGDICWEGDIDYVRTNQMTWLTAEIINFCFGEGLKTSPGRWNELLNDLDSWKSTLPETFQPLYIMHDDEIFPEISYLCTWHVIGMQFYHLSKVLLALHNPHQAGGIDFLHFARSVEAEILEHTVQICGMTRSLGSKHPGALVNAVQPLVICGRNLKREEEQLELLRMLRQIERDTAWSTVQGIQSLQEAWRA